MGVNSQRDAPATFTPGERNPGTHWIGDWVVLKSRSGHRLEEKSFASAGDRTLMMWSSSPYGLCAVTQKFVLLALYNMSFTQNYNDHYLMQTLEISKINILHYS
jgi:hypothetical protein